MAPIHDGGSISNIGVVPLSKMPLDGSDRRDADWKPRGSGENNMT